jgi:hypothetical protein
MKQHAANRQWSVDDNLTTERQIMVTVVGVPEPLELLNDEQIGQPLKRRVEDWLARECKN